PAYGADRAGTAFHSWRRSCCSPPEQIPGARLSRLLAQLFALNGIPQRLKVATEGIVNELPLFPLRIQSGLSVVRKPRTPHQKTVRRAAVFDKGFKGAGAQFFGQCVVTDTVLFVGTAGVHHQGAVGAVIVQSNGAEGVLQQLV